MENEEKIEIVHQTEEYWSKMDEKAILLEMGRIIGEYKEQNSIEMISEEEFTDIFGSDTLYPVNYNPLSMWLDAYHWTTAEWQDLFYIYEIDQLGFAEEDIDCSETDELSENDQLIDILDEYNEDLINSCYGSSPRILENVLCVGETADKDYNYNEMISVDYIDYNETLSEISNDFWSDGPSDDQYVEWLGQIERERSETFFKINAKGHRQDLSPSEIDAIIGLACQRYLADTIDTKLGDAILSMLRIVHFFKFKMIHQVEWYNKHQPRVDQETKRFKKEQNLTSWSDEVEWIKKNGPIKYTICIQDLMLQVLYTMNGSHYRINDPDYEWEEEFDKIFVEMPYGPEFDKVIINFLLLPLYKSTHRE
jgi:hypothetical protein